MCLLYAPRVGDTGNKSQSTISLAPGAEANVIFTGITNSVAGAWNMYAIVDTHEYVIVITDLL